ncbi:MAG: tetratricopeptide repeat protein [Anaerolineales bacterium]
MDISQQLRKAYETAKTGDRPQARQILKEILKVEPDNDAAWYLYAKIAENRQRSIECLEKVLQINPSHPRARQDLARFKNENAGFTNPQEKPLRSNTRQAQSNGRPSRKFPGWIWVIGAGFAGISAILCAGYIVFTGAFLPRTQAPGQITAQPLVLSTPTNDCTCTQATGYLDKTFSRFDSISTQIMNIQSAYEAGNPYQLNFAAFSSEAKTIYKEQLAESPPSCLQAFQNKAVSLLWNWQQTMEYAANGQYDAVDLFIQGFLDDFSALENEGERLLNEELNGCIMDPNSGPSL